MPHTRRARELGLSRVTIGTEWDQHNDRFKLRLCWAEQCIALCLGSDGMTEVRIALANIMLEDSGEGQITLKFNPKFPRKFYGHTVHHYNALREIQRDPCNGALDRHCQALCYVRGGDPVKLATDFVARVARFRLEVNIPAPPPRQIARDSFVAPLGPQSVKSGIWNGQRSLIRLEKDENINNGSPISKPVTGGPRNPRADNKFTGQVWRREKPMNMNEDMAGPISEAQNFSRGNITNENVSFSRTQKNGVNSLRGSSLIVGDSEINAQLINLNIDGPFSNNFGGGNEGISENRRFTNANVQGGTQARPSGSGTLDLINSFKYGLVAEKSNNKSNIANSAGNGKEGQPQFPQYSTTGALVTPSHGLAGMGQGVYASPLHTTSGDNSANVSPNSTSSIWTTHSSPSPVTSANPSASHTMLNTPRTPPAPLLFHAPIESLPYSNASIWAHTPNTIEVNRPQLQTPAQPQLHIMKNGPGPTINPMAANDLVTLQARPKITLIYKPSTMGAISVRPARADCSLADLMIQASSCWTIPLEEVKLFGKFDGLRVQLIGEGDFDGYIGVCLSHNEKIVVEVEREYMGGNHRNNSNAGLGAVGTIGGIRTHS